MIDLLILSLFCCCFFRVHIHRPTRFDHTGIYRPVEDYMSEVEDYYSRLNLSYPVMEKAIFLATNDVDLFEEIQEK